MWVPRLGGVRRRDAPNANGIGAARRRTLPCSSPAIRGLGLGTLPRTPAAFGACFTSLRGPLSRPPPRVAPPVGDAMTHRRRDSHIILVHSFPESVRGKLRR